MAAAPRHVGLFFGTFNPVHIGHLAIASYMAEFTVLDEVWLVLSPHNPHKEKLSLLKDQHRAYMLRLALEPFGRKMRFSDVELKLPQPSYTIYTLKILEEKYPGKIFSLILGSDNLRNFAKWKNHDEILSQHELFIYPREKDYSGPFADHPSVHLTEAPLMEISSTFIRNAIKAGKDMQGFLPEPVYRYITEMHFYQK